MTDTQVAAYARLREAVLTGNEPVRALCAREGVSWQAFYKHARRHGWSLRQSGRRRPGPRGAEGKVRAIVETYLAALEGEGPRTHLSAARMMASCAAMLGRLQNLARKTRTTRHGRPLPRPITDAGRLALARRISALGDEMVAKRARKRGDQCTDEQIQG